MAKKAESKPVPGLDRELEREEAEALVAGDPEFLVFVLLRLSMELAQLRAAHASVAGPSAPSSATPAYRKATTPAGRKGRSKRGAKNGHPGNHRPSPPRIDRTESHPLASCPKCGGKVTPSKGDSGRRTRTIEDIPKDTQTEVVEHVIETAYCGNCKKMVEAKVPDALPGSHLGHRVMVFAAWLRFGLGLALSQIREVLNAHLQFKISDGGLVESAHRIAQILKPWYEEIACQIKASGVLNADETGWRVLGKTHWLWCFCSELAQATYYMIDRSRGSPALTKFFTEAVKGILVTDFWSAYNAVACAGRQMCLPHLFRNLDSTSEKDESEQWRAFVKKLKRLLRDGLRLRTAEGLADNRYASRRERLDARLTALLAPIDTSKSSSANHNVKRIVKRLRSFQKHIFTFLDHEHVPSDNNHAEREIRPAVIMRKNTQCNQSDRGAETQAILMTIFRTLRRRGLQPLDEVVQALRHYSLSGRLPPLPGPPPTSKAPAQQTHTP
jgi:transposase